MNKEELSWVSGAWKKGVGRQIEKEKDGKWRKKRKGRQMEKEKRKNKGGR